MNPADPEELEAISALPQEDDEGEGVGGAPSPPLLLSWHDTFRQESQYMVSIACPITAGCVAYMSVGFTCLVLAGHYLNPSEIAGFSLSVLYNDIGGFRLASGFTGTVIDTLCTQEYGTDPTSPNVRLHMQNAIIFVAPILFLWMLGGFFATPILLLFGQVPTVVDAATLCIHTNMLCLAAYVLFEALKRYLQAQNRALPGMFSMGLAALVNPFLSLYLVRLYGLRGLAVGYGISLSLPAVLLLGYLCFKRELPFVFTESPTHAKECYRLGLPGIVMGVAEYLVFCYGMVVAGWLGSMPQAAFSFTLQFGSFLYMVPQGLAGAVVVRVGNLLGEGAPTLAKRATMIITGYALLWATAGFTFVLVLHRQIPHFFTVNPAISEIMASCLVIFAPFVFPDTAQAVSQGVFRGAGRQSVGMWCNLVVFYPFVVPAMTLGTLLWRDTGYGASALWATLALGQVVAVGVMITMVCRMQWRRVTV